MTHRAPCPVLRWLAVCALGLALLVPTLAAPGDASGKPRKPRRRAAPPPPAATAPAPPPSPAPAAPARPAPARPAGERPQPGLAIEGAAPVEGSSGPYGRRVEFDALTVLGQTKAAGAVYLFERQRSDLHSMVERRRSYREELRRALHDRRP